MGAARKGFGDMGVRGWCGGVSHGTELAERGVPGLRRGERRGYERGRGTLPEANNFRRLHRLKRGGGKCAEDGATDANEPLARD